MPLQPNRFGLTEALVGFAVGLVAAGLAVTVFGALTNHLHHPGTFGSDVTSLIALWTCWVGAALVASASARRRGGTSTSPVRGALGSLRSALGRLRDDYGLELRPWPDLPIGIVVGVASQYLLVPVFELPLLPFVPHLYTRLGGPANELTGGANGASLALLGVLVCVGSPVVEELFFRGLLLRSVAGRLEQLPLGRGRAPLGPRLRAVVSVLAVGVAFGLAHFEALQLLALIGFGCVLGTLAWRSGRLGPGIVAHAAFNTVTILSLAFAH